MPIHLVLIDALNLIRRIYAVQERPFLQKHEISAKTKQQIVHNTTIACEQALTKIISTLEPSHILTVFDCQGDCWRKEMFADYKKGRKAMPEHLFSSLAKIQDLFLKHHVDSLLSEEDEADDLIATLAIKVALRGQNTTIVSTDKGFLPLLAPNIQVYDHFNRRFLDEVYVKEKFNIKPNKLIDLWSLTGDSTNNIPGVPGIGQVTASKLLNQYGSVKGLLDATDLKNTIADKLKQNQDQIKLSKTLLSHKLDIPLGFNLQDIRLPIIKEDRLTQSTQ